jgi:hypothetical protein
MSDEREFRLTGQAAEALNPRKRRTRKYKGGDNSGALMQVAGQEAGNNFKVPSPENISTQYASQVKTALDNNFGPTKVQQFGGNSTGAIVNLSSTRSTPGLQNANPIVSGVSPSQPAPVGGGVTLVPKRKNRISLKAKKGGSTSLTNVPPPAGGTRKLRKINIRVKGVTSRLMKAKKARKDAMTASISQVRSKLEAAGVIKKTSKAPEHMMRTMYADLLITKKGL